jgi:hypothetical protein
VVDKVIDDDKGVPAQDPYGDARPTPQDPRSELPTVNKVESVTPIPRDTSKWADIDRKFRAFYGEPRSISQESSKNKNSIENNYQISIASNISNNYSMFHCEDLLSSAKNLLDNALPLREHWRDLGAQEFLLKQEVDEFRELDKIHNEEIKHGYYDLTYNRINAQRESEWKIYQENNYAQIYLNYSGVSDIELENYKKHLDLINFFANMPITTEEFSKTFWVYQTPTGIKGKKPEVMEQLAWPVTRLQKKLIGINLKIQKIAAQAAADSSFARYQGLSKELTWTSNDIKHRRARTQASRDQVDLKMLEATRPNGALNYKERRDALQTRFQHDFAVAVAMAEVARTGLQKLYGISLSYPNPAAAGFYDQLSNWVTDSMHALNRFQRMEQSYAKVIVAASTSVSRNWKFTVDEKSFRGQSHLRLRGVSAHIVGDTKGCWEIRLKPPLVSFIRHSDGKQVALEEQKGVRTVIFGRTQRRDFGKEADLVGLSALRNISPLGDWTIEVEEKSTAGEPLDRLKGVEIDLHLAFVPT